MANFIERLFGKAAPRKQQPFNINLIGQTITVYPYSMDTYLKKGYQGNSVIYGMISKIASKAAEVPGVLYKVKKGKNVDRYKAISKSYTPDGLGRMLSTKANTLDEVPDTDQFAKLLAKPNPSQSEAEFRRSVLTMKLIYGGSPVYANMGESGKQVYSVYSYPTPNVRLQADESLMNFSNAWLNFGGRDMLLPREQVYYLRYLNPDINIQGTHLYGQSPMMAGLKNLKASNENVDFMAFMYEKRGANGLFTPKTSEDAARSGSVPGGIDGMRTTLDQLIADRIGSGTSRPYFNMPLDYLSFGMDAGELKVIEGDEQLTKGLARLYDFPLPLLSLESSTDNNYQNAIKYLVSNTCYGHLVDYRDMVNDWLLPLAGAEGYFWDFDITEMPELQSDIKALAEWLTKTEAVTLNEVRDALKYDRLDYPYMNEPLISGSKKPISLLDASEAMIEPNLLAGGN